MSKRALIEWCIIVSLLWITCWWSGMRGLLLLAETIFLSLTLGMVLGVDYWAKRKGWDADIEEKDIA